MVDEAYRSFIEENETFMGANILNAEIKGSPLFSPFEQARQREREFGDKDLEDFIDDVDALERPDSNPSDNSDDDGMETNNVDDLLVV